MESQDITTKILIEIRDEIRQTNLRLDQTNQCLDQTNQRLDQTNQRLDQTKDELGKHIVEVEVRTATAISALAGTLSEIKIMLADQLDLRARVEHCEHEIVAIKEQISA